MLAGWVAIIAVLPIGAYVYAAPISATVWYRCHCFVGCRSVKGLLVLLAFSVTLLSTRRDDRSGRRCGLRLRSYVAYVYGPPQVQHY